MKPWKDKANPVQYSPAFSRVAVISIWVTGSKFVPEQFGILNLILVYQGVQPLKNYLPVFHTLFFVLPPFLLMSLFP